ncbi:protein of unknown function (DUF4470) domain containing protein [Amanita muscaria]
MDELIQLFSTMMTPARMAEAQAEALRSFERDLSAQSENVRVLPPDPGNPATNASIPKDVNSIREMMEQTLHPRNPPPTSLPCANVQPAKYTICKDPGTMACSACKLVSYCSKECQKAHWKQHKQDCKNSMRSADWTPSWIRERRSPSFITDTPEIDDFEQLQKEEFSVGMSLWGNTPAVDVINLACNENDAKKDFSLAFIASGDLRHVLRSFNSLPSDYSGHLNILLNDINPSIFCRNVVLLLILGNVSDETMAADMALHFWYSVFMPAEYRCQLSVILISFLQQVRENPSLIPLGPRSTLSTLFPKEFLTNHFSPLISSSFSIGDIQDEYNRVRTAPSRQDFRDRMYASLKPSHRVAFQEYRRFGIVLPFGAMNAHFNCPNLSLFSPEGEWLQTDYADPLKGWDIPAIIDAGKAHGAHPEDIYGCLYFFLSKQLRTFASRLRRFSSSFTILPMDARDLPQLIRKNEFSDFNIPSSIKFDRIEVSNILDTNYVGIHDVLTLWGPLLQESRSAAIIGYFMNWTMFEKAGRASGAGGRVMKDLVKKVLEKEKVISLQQMQAMLHGGLDDIELFYENSQPFFKFLRSQGLDGLLKKTGLRLRDKHTIVPHVRGSLCSFADIYVDSQTIYSASWLPWKDHQPHCLRSLRLIMMPGIIM